MNSYIEEVAKSGKFDDDMKNKLLEQSQETLISNDLLKKFENIVHHPLEHSKKNSF